MWTIASLGALAGGATSTPLFAHLKTLVAAAPGLIGGRGLVALGIGAVIGYATFRPLLRPVLRFLDRHLFWIGAFCTPLHRALRKIAERANNKGARIQYNKREKLYAKNFQAGPR